MFFCTKCGKELSDTYRFCPKCGSPNVEYSGERKYVEAPPPPSPDSEYADAQKNKSLSVLAYFGILFFVPLLAAPGSKFARFHANQGLVFLITTIVLGAANSLLGQLFRAIFRSGYGFRGNFLTMSFPGTALAGLCSIVVVAAALTLFFIGVANASKGIKKELPVVGKFKIIE